MNGVNSIEIERLFEICDILDTTPNDLMEYHEGVPGLTKEIIGKISKLEQDDKECLLLMVDHKYKRKSDKNAG